MRSENKSKTNRELAMLARRMAKAFKAYGAFIYDRALDAPELVGRVVRSAGIALLVINKVLDSRKGIYAIVISDRGCKAECTYGGPCSINDEKCLKRCIEECRVKIVKNVVDALEKLAERLEMNAR